MGSRETQALIISTALTLFNEHSSGAVSTNRVAEACNISKGNLHYHFKTKKEIIQSIFKAIADEMNDSWYQDHLNPTIKHMAEMFARQLLLINDYRFFYREMPALLRSDPVLLRRYQENRDKRMSSLVNYFEELSRLGVLDFKHHESMIQSFVVSTWIISDNWLNYIEFKKFEPTSEKILEGYEMMLDILRPYFTQPWDEVLAESKVTIKGVVENNQEARARPLPAK
ncbi:MAG: AcrR family transcriptional regulator [Planctomycetota bacterium]|jgi:AcrR family transcriptional regulator